MFQDILKRWEAQDKQYHYFIEISPTLVYVWQTMGAPITEAGGSCTHNSFLEGQYNEIVRKIFGKNVLEEVKEFISKTNID